MAKKMIIITYTSRQNIILWLETFRNSGKGLKQETINIFDKGNDYKTNTLINNFNKKAQIIITALEKNGIELKKNTKNQYTISFKMLKSLTLDKFTDELTDLIFDPVFAEIDYADKNTVSVLSKLYKENKLNDFDSINYFKAFASFGNITALEWLIKTYKLKNYDIHDRRYIEMIKILTSSSKYEDELIDLYLKSNIIKEGSDFMNSMEMFNTLLLLSRKSLEKILPLIRIEEDDEYCLLYLNNFLKNDPSLIELFNFNTNDLKELAKACVNYIESDIGLFKSYKSLIEKIIKIYPEFFELLIKNTNWIFSYKIFEFIPEVKDIFLF